MFDLAMDIATMSLAIAFAVLVLGGSMTFIWTLIKNIKETQRGKEDERQD